LKQDFNTAAYIFAARCTNAGPLFYARFTPDYRKNPIAPPAFIPDLGIFAEKMQEKIWIGFHFYYFYGVEKPI
jgi:hypothetical protein